MSNDLAILSSTFHALQGRPRETRKVELCQLTLSDALRTTREHFPSVLEWMEGFQSPDHLLFEAVDDASQSLKVIVGRARLAAAKACFHPRTEVTVSIYPGFESEACCVAAYGRTSCADLTVSEKVELGATVRRVLGIATRDPVVLSEILGDILDNTHFTVRLCRFSLITDRYFRRALSSAFGKDKVVHTALYRALIAAYGVSRRNCVAKIQSSANRNDLIKALTGGGCALTKALVKKGYREERAEEISEALDDIPVTAAVQIINSSHSRCARVRSDEDLPSPAVLIEGVKSVFSSQYRATMKRLGRVADVLSGDFVVLPGREADQLITRESIEEIVEESEEPTLIFLVREKNDAAFFSLDSVNITIHTTETREDSEGRRVQSVDGQLIRVINGRVMEKEELSQWIIDSGLSLDMNIEELTGFLGGPFSLGIANIEIPSHNALLVDFLPHINQIVIERGDSKNLKNCLKENFMRIRLDIRKPKKSGGAANAAAAPNRGTRKRRAPN